MQKESSISLRKPIIFPPYSSSLAITLLLLTLPKLWCNTISYLFTYTLHIGRGTYLDGEAMTLSKILNELNVIPILPQMSSFSQLY